MDAVETNTFGANLANLAEYDIADRILELAEAGAAARPRGRPTTFSTAGPAALGARLGRPGHQAADPRPRRRTPTLRDAYQQQVAGMLDGGVDARARRDLPGPAAGQGGGPRRAAGDGRRRASTCR